MKDTIYTIPLTDAMNEKGECPFCFIHKKLEEDSIYFTLGASYMEDDIRAETDKKGFCPTHFQKLYDYGNRLGLALILDTHYKALTKEIEKLFETGSLPSPSFLDRLTKKAPAPKAGEQTLGDGLSHIVSGCYICDRIQKDKERYYNTFFYLYTTNDEFRTLFEESKGFCITHLAELTHVAPYLLKEKERDDFLSTSKELLLASMKRLEADLSWFIDKNDYRNANAPWGEAETAIPRSIQKLTGTYVNQPVFKQK